MDINVITNGSELIIELSGRLDTTSSPSLEEKKKLFKDYESLVLDLTNLSYLTSAGLRVIMNFQKVFKDKFVVQNVNADIMEIFEMTGFSSILNIR